MITQAKHYQTPKSLEIYANDMGQQQSHPIQGSNFFLIDEALPAKIRPLKNTAILKLHFEIKWTRLLQAFKSKQMLH